MGELVDKIKGNVNELVGKAKEALGDHNNDADLKAEGEAQQLKGKGQEVKGSVKGALGDNI
ncbi:CsbD family protein [Sphingomonas sp.]|uniref:CsbD family protein n=1 Tax=Sphingomonas sp. TaxID=28214 RepID=UPI0031DE9B35